MADSGFNRSPTFARPRYTGNLRSVIYMPVPIRVPDATIEAVEREAEFVAE
ncbi:hypothetical protein [Nocardia sp. NBC_00403]|uniref:hypothetical protein n=1 Tax=Nocardia sp. NBC_00403 TaxID=2975990 RepID=UPI002E1B4ABF